MMQVIRSPRVKHYMNYNLIEIDTRGQIQEVWISDHSETMNHETNS